MEVSEASFENLPVISPSVHPGEPPDLDDLCATLSKEEICTAISQLKNSRAPGMDGISAEMIKLGGAESVGGSSPYLMPSGSRTRSQRTEKASY